MTARGQWVKTGACLTLSLAVLVLVLSGVHAQRRPGPLIVPPPAPLNNGSLQTTILPNGTVTHIATLPLCARLPGAFTGWVTTSFALQGGVPGAVYVPPGSNATGNANFTCIVNNSPFGGNNIVCVPGNVNVVGAGTGGLNPGMGASAGCGGGNFLGGATNIASTTFGGGIGGANGFFPCSLPQGVFPGALVQRIFLPGFVDSVQCPSIMVNPQILGGIPTLPVQIGSGFGGLVGSLFQGGLPTVQGQGFGGFPIGGNFGGLVKGGFNGMAGSCGAYGY
ncbi:MAG: hypothetical protein NZ700_05400 [Gemmataceae bacterium]|nr:hypothetical protein [Gemmataceae bacterium]MDW8264775.1 hypothetical protein [Gemmataceae bacterium]